jgi:hypothetical protein
MEKGSFIMSGQYEQITISSLIEPAWIVLNEDFQMAWAATGWQDTLMPGSNNSFSFSNWNVQVSSVDDDVIARIEQIWSYPDPLKAWSEKPYKLNAERYWKVEGVGLNQADMRATFFYDGRENNATGKPDGDLFTHNNEDSLVLLYRSSAKFDWEVYGNYEKNVLGNVEDAFGTIEINPVLPGEYVLGIIAQSALGDDYDEITENIKVYPNPTSGEITVDQTVLMGVALEVYDLHGRKLITYPLAQKVQTLQLPSWDAGVYICKVYGISGQVLKEQRLVFKK